MAVFVDDMYKVAMGKFARMKMSHMMADTEEELHAMAEKIGMRREWFQGDHYDVSLSKRRDALFHGAKSVTMRQLAVMRRMGREQGKRLGDPEKARQWLDQHRIEAAE